MYKSTDGNSSVQQRIEAEILSKLETEFGVLEKNQNLPLPEDPDVKIRPDFYSESKKIIGEIHSHLGKLKPAQKHKVAADILKLHLFDPDHLFQKYYVVCSKEEYNLLQGKSYLAAAVKEYGIKVKYVDIGTESRADLQDAMKKQNMFPE